MYKRQEAFRYTVEPSIEGTFEITRIDEKPVTLQPGSLEILDISPEGLKIQSRYNISSEKLVEIRFNFVLNEAPLTLEGYFMWQKAYTDQFIYGVRLNIDKATKSQLIEELKLYAKRMKKE